MSNFNKNPPQTFARLFRPWESDNYVAAEQPPKPSEAAQNHPANNCTVDTTTNSLNINLPAATTSSFSGTESESDRECASSSSSCSKSSSYEESFNTNNNNQGTPASSNSPTMANSMATQINYTSPYFYGPAAPAFNSPFTTHFQPAVNTSNMSYMMPAAMPATSHLYYAAAAAAAAANSDMPSTSAAAYALNSYAFNFMDSEYARVMVEDAQLKAANARKQRPKKFKCNLCDVAFSNNGQLKGHIRIHTGERPFKCDFETCDKTFTRNEELTRHKRIHTGLKPYPCPICGKCFGRRDHLSKHLKTHLPKATMYLAMYQDFYRH